MISPSRTKRTRRATYLPITSIVVAICVLAAALIIMTMRDVDRGRSHVLDALDRKAMGMLTFLRTDLRTELISPIWQPERLQLFSQEVANRANLTYLALVAEDGRVLVHSDPAVVGTVLDGWQPDVSELPRRHLDRRRTTVGLADGTVVEVVEYAARVDVNPQRLCSPSPLRLGRHARMMPRPSSTPSIVAQRLSQLLGEPVVETDELVVYAVVALDPTDLESVFFASRDRSLVLAGALLVIGAAAIYFLFVSISYRSTRTALANMRSYTNNVIESMASGLISVDHDSRVVRVNSRARELFDLGTRSIRGEAIEDVVRFEKGDARDDIRDVLAGERRVAEAEIGIETQEGRIPVEISASLLLDEDGTRTGAVLLFQDLRELEALKAAVERERHLAALGRLAAGVAHEVRNPLSSLKGFAQFLRSKFNPGSEEERYSDIMIEEVERLDRVVQELLDFAKPVTADRSESNVNDIINDALSLVSEDATFRGVEVVTELGEGLPAVLVDARQLRQALLNVLLNGIDAMRDGGRLTVRTALRSGDTPQVVIDVIDTGVGMTEEEQDKLFEPFYTTKPEGTGLGLTIVSRLIEQNRGHIGLRSEPGEGTVFSISFSAVVGCSGDVEGTAGRSANGPDNQESQSEE